MYLEIKEIGPDGLSIDRRIDFRLPSPDVGQELVRVSQVHLSGEIFREGRDTSFSGDIGTIASVSCSRCVEIFDLPLDLHFDLLYTSDKEEVPKRESRVDEDSVTVVHLDGDRIDLDHLLEEQIYLGLPLKPLCRQDCRGLCARCGANLNQDACACDQQPTGDPRLLKLKGLL